MTCSDDFRAVHPQQRVIGEEPGEPDCSGNVEEPGRYCLYTLDNPADVKSIVIAGAGTETCRRNCVNGAQHSGMSVQFG